MSNQTMTPDSFYEGVMESGNFRTPAHAQRATFAVLHTLGFNLSGSTKKDLANALPKELAGFLTRGWKLINIRHKNLPLDEFAKEVALDSGNTDHEVAKVTSRIIFRQMKSMIDDGLIREVTRDLSPEVSHLWKVA